VLGGLEVVLMLNLGLEDVASDVAEGSGDEDYCECE
jgi:hypothetical protein